MLRLPYTTKRLAAHFASERQEHEAKFPTVYAFDDCKFDDESGASMEANLLLRAHVAEHQRDFAAAVAGMNLVIGVLLGQITVLAACLVSSLFD